MRGFMVLRNNNYYKEEEEEEEEEEGMSTGEEERTTLGDYFRYRELGLRRRRRQVMRLSEDLSISGRARDIYLRNCGKYTIQNPSKPLDNDAKMKGVVNSCTLKPVLSYHPCRRERGGPSGATCVICTDVISISDTLQSPNCIHRFCKGCIEVYLEGKIQEDITRVKCPESKCEVALGMEFCKGIIPKEVFDRWKVALLESSVLESPDRITCPFQECSALFFDDGRNYLTRACPKCCRIFCMRCRVPWHLGKTCATFQRTSYHHLLRPGYLMFLRKQR